MRFEKKDIIDIQVKEQVGLIVICILIYLYVVMMGNYIGEGNIDQHLLKNIGDAPNIFEVATRVV